MIVLHLESQPGQPDWCKFFEIVKVRGESSLKLLKMLSNEKLPLVLLFMKKKSWVTEIASEPTLKGICFPLLFFSSFSCTLCGLGQSLKEVGQVLSTTRKESKT